MPARRMVDMLPLLKMLDQHGITYPDAVHRGVAAHEHLTAPGIFENVRMPGQYLLDLTPQQAEDLARHDALAASHREHFRNHAGHLSGVIGAAVADHLTDHLDDLLDQLRPRFTKASAVVTRAIKAGIGPGDTADTVIAKSDAAVTAWRALEAAVKELETIAQIRIRLCQALDLPPLPLRFGEQHPQWGACFTTTGGYYDPESRDITGRWLRLAAAGLHLNDAATTRSLVVRTRTAPIAPSGDVLQIPAAAFR